MRHRLQKFSFEDFFFIKISFFKNFFEKKFQNENIDFQKNDSGFGNMCPCPSPYNYDFSDLFMHL